MSNWWEKQDTDNLTVWQALKTPEGVDYYYNTVTKETSWDKPEELMTDAERAGGQGWVWVPDETDCYVQGQVLSTSGDKTTVELETGETVTVLTAETQPLKKSSLKRVVADLTLLDEMSTPLILHNLKQRFLKDKIYTNIGTILISINPYKFDLGYYTHAVIQKYISRGLEERDPHVYNTAHNAWIGLTEFKANQAIIISGESGAGKTEATKQCLKYIAAIAGSVGNIEAKILQANPILEGFGNAKTIRNDNSSRFGKYMEVFFTKSKPHMICGSTTTNYLLEKIRVVAPNDNERNYHVFYQITKSADASLRKQLLLEEPGSYRYLAACLDVPTLDDDKEYAELREAFTVLDFNKDDVMGIFQLLAGILNVGNVTFKAGGKNASVVDPKYMNNAAKLFGVDSAALTKALLFRTLKIPGQKPTDVPHSEMEAAYARDALSKFIYGNMFDWLVVRINKAMGKAPKGLLSIGILDIFGFEIFKQNSFEQLCINFTNEMLQQHFNQNTFKLEEQLYRAEKIRFDHVDFIDNEPMIKLITARKPLGIIPMLDEELVVPRGSDAGFLDKLNRGHARTKCFKESRKVRHCFIVCHYAGDVLYDTRGFMDKNRDKLTDDLLTLVQGSSSPLMNTLFNSKSAMSDKDKKASLGKNFVKQLNTLIETLNQTEPHYIRCLKPNEDKAAMVFVPRNCLEQMTYSGVFEAVRIRKQGFPFRLKHAEFLSRYTCIVDKPKSCDDIIKQMNLNQDNVRMGASMVLYRAEEHKALELKRSIKVKTIEIDAALKEITATNHNKLSKADKDEFLNKLARAVMQADEFRLKTAVSEKARDLLDGFIQARLDGDPECKRALEAANATKDQQQLEAAVEMADKRGYQACHYVRETKRVLKDVTKANDMLKKAKDELEMAGWNTQMVGEAIQNAESIQYNSMLVDECRQLKYRVDRVLQEANSAFATMEENHVRAVVTAAAELRISNQTIDHFNHLVNSGPYDGFLEAQYAKAKEINDHARAIRCDMKRKDILIDAQGAQFGLKSYTKLKRADTWSREKLFGGIGAEKRAMAFLKWQKGCIHSEMCNYSGDKKALKMKKKLLKAAFKALIGFMNGTGKPGVNETALALALNQAQQDKEMRDELYVHVMKQLTSIPGEVPNSAQISAKGFEWLGCLMNAFGPSADLETQVEAFVRGSNDSKASKYKLKGQLRRRMYEGDAKNMPSQSDISSAAQYLQGKANGFDDPPLTGQESFTDIKTPYSEVLRANGIQPAGRPGQHQQQQRPMGGAPRAAAPAAAAKPSPWQATKDPASGRTYYYNTETNETTWEKPAGFA